MEYDGDFTLDDNRCSGLSVKSDRKTSSGLEADPSSRRQEEKLMLQAMIDKQAHNRYFNQNAPHIKYRETVVLWLLSTVRKLNYRQVTLHVAVAFFDAISSLSLISLEQVKLVAFVCLYLSAKLEQRNNEIPTISDCLALFENQFSRKDFETCEALIFKMLKYRLNVVTPYHFLSYFLMQQATCAGEALHLAEKVEAECFALLEKTLMGYEFYRYTSIAVASAIIAAARNRFALASPWSKGLEELTMVTYESIGVCAQAVLALCARDGCDSRGSDETASSISEIRG